MKLILIIILLFISIVCHGQKKDTLNWQDILNRNGSDTSYTIDWGGVAESHVLPFIDSFPVSSITYDTTYGIILYIQMEDSLILGVYDNAPVFAPSFSPILARAMRVEEIETNIERGWTFGKYTIDPETEHPITTTKTTILIDLQTPKILDPDKWFIFIPYSKFQK